MSWAARKRLLYIGTMILVLGVLGVWIGYNIWYEAPTCFDGIRNGNEQGIDCGGGCERVCSFEAVEPVVLWSRFFDVDSGLYSVVALIENPNITAEAFDVPYVFKLRDEDGILVYERKGRAYVPPQSTFAIFEPGIRTGTRVPRSVFFEFSGVADWVRTTESIPTIGVRDTEFSERSGSPRVTGRISNDTLVPIPNVEVIAILFNESGNAIGASRTTIDVLEPESSQNLVFTWPRPFEESVAKVDIIPQILP